MTNNLYQTPEEQLRQVMAWYPNKKLYKNPSSLSGKLIISMYPPAAACPVYSHEEWYDDTREAPSIEVNTSRSFFDQFKALQKIAPVVSLLSHSHENAEYCNDSTHLKDCYLVFDAINCQSVYYSTRIYNSRSCVDVYWVMESELLYECVYMFSCYNTRYSFHCENVSDSAFLFDCKGTRNSFMCSGLRNQEYCIYNKQYTKEEYEKFIAGINFEDFEEMEKLKYYFLATLLPEAHARASFVVACENVSGVYMKNSQNVVRGFESFNVKDCENIFQCGDGVDMQGTFMCNDRVEKCYQSVATGIGIYDARNCAFVWTSARMEYSYMCISCKDCFGCIGLRNKQFCIFNKQYSEEEYHQRKSELVEAMKSRGEYGLFFPQELSPFLYEDTIAYDFFEGKSSVLESFAMPSSDNVHYIPQELEFYKAHKIPKPKVPFVGRYKKRLAIMNTPLAG